MTGLAEFSLDLDYLPRLPHDRSPAIGCIGAGFIMADCHLVAYRQAGFNPVAIASRNPDHARQVAERHGLTAYDGYHQMLENRDLQIVDVAVPPDVQFEVIRQVVERHGHIRGILAQKPLGVNYAQAAEIVRLCESAGIVLAVNQNMR